MQEHPVPQNITSYQFRLVGDMTLKQFVELAAGLLIAYLFFSSNLIFIIKWPLVIFSAILGIATAFLPIEERPLDQWIINFLKAIYSPTRYTWKKTGQPPSIFTFKKKQHPKEKPTTKKTTKKLPAIDHIQPQDQKIDLEEKSRLSQVNQLLTKLGPSAQTQTLSPLIKPPKPTVSVRKLKASVIFQSPTITIKPTQPTSKKTPPPPPSTQPSPKTTLKKITALPPQPISLLKERETAQKQIELARQKTKTQVITILEKPTVSKHKIEGNIKQATTVTQYMPLTPKDPNIVVGIVVDNLGRLTENSIVQITSEDGIPQRAVKTNKLGQFSISTPLRNGEYILEAEKDNLTFEPLKIKTEGKILPPFLVKAS